MTDHSGKNLGQYQIKEMIGKGGMAVVYRAHQPSMKRDVAIKVMSSELGRDPDFVERFTREAELFAVLQHPHILPVIDFGHEGSAVFIVMRLVEGGSLDDRIKKGHLDLPVAARMLEQIGSALSFAHDKGIVHRDLKPNNVLLDTRGNTYLTDFGIAKMLAGTTRLTATNAVLGTPAYMAPEQWRGGNIDARTDIYSMGIMAYEMVTGRLPFEADTSFTLMYKHFNDLPPEEYMAHLPPLVRSVILKALMKDPDDRFSSAEEFGQAFRAAVEGRPINLSTASKTEVDNDATMIGGIESPFPTSQRTAATDQYTGGASQPRITSQPTPAPMPVERKRGNGLLLGGIVVLLLLIAGAAAFFLVLNRDDNGGEIVEANTATPTETITPTDEPSSTPTAENASATVQTERTVVRSGPGEQYEQVFVIPRGTEVNVLAVTTEQDWYQVEVAGDTGWIPADTISLSGNLEVIEVVEKPSPTPTPTDTPTDIPSATPTEAITDTPVPQDAIATVLTQRTVVRAGPDEQYEDVFVLPRDTQVQVIAVTTEQDWYQVEVAGDTGWVSADTVSISGNMAVIEIVEKPTLTPTPTDTPTPRPTSTPTGTVEVPIPFTPTPTFSGGTEIAVADDLTPEQERELASLLPIRATEVEIEDFEDTSVSWEGGTVQGGALEITSQGELSGTGYLPGYPVVRDFYADMEFVGNSDDPDYAFAFWFRTQSTDQSGYVIALDNNGFLQIGYNSDEGYDEVDVVSNLDVDFTQTTRLSVLVISNFLEVHVNDRLIGTFVIDNSSAPGTVEFGVYTFEVDDPAVTVAVQEFALYEIQLQPPLDKDPDNDLFIGEVINPISLSFIPDGRQSPRRLLRGDKVWILGRSNDWAYVYSGRAFGWLQANGLDIQLDGNPVSVETLPEINAQGFPVRDFRRFANFLANFETTTTTTTSTERGMLQINTPVEDILASGETHRWQFTAEADQAYLISLEQLDLTIDPYLTVLDADGNVIAEDDDSAGNLNSMVRLEGAQGNEYIIEARSVNQNDTGPYRIQVQVAGTTETTDERLITVGQPVEDSLEAGTIHTWTLTVQAGTSYQITMERLSDELDPYLVLKDEAGTILAEDDDAAGNLNAQITYTFSSAGNYLIDARSYNLTNAGDYRLSVAEAQVSATTPVVTEVPVTEFVLEIGVPQRTTLNPTEVHTWQFEGQAGQTYIITMDNISGNIDPRITLKDASGNILGENDDKPGSYNSELSFTAAANGTYFIEAATYSPDQTGEYLIQVVLD